MSTSIRYTDLVISIDLKRAPLPPDVEQSINNLARKRVAEMYEQLMHAMLFTGSATSETRADGSMEVIDPHRRTGIIKADGIA